MQIKLPSNLWYVLSMINFMQKVIFVSSSKKKKINTKKTLNQVLAQHCLLKIRSFGIDRKQIKSPT